MAQLYRMGRILTVLDAKYTTLDAATPPNEHLYQLLSYCTALNLSNGHLVYAAATTDAATDHVVRRCGITITTHALDLNQSPSALLSSVSALANRIATPLQPTRTSTTSATPV